MKHRRHISTYRVLTVAFCIATADILNSSLTLHPAMDTGAGYIGFTSVSSYAAAFPYRRNLSVLNCRQYCSRVPRLRASRPQTPILVAVCTGHEMTRLSAVKFVRKQN